MQCETRSTSVCEAPRPVELGRGGENSTANYQSLPSGLPSSHRTARQNVWAVIPAFTARTLPSIKPHISTPECAELGYQRIRPVVLPICGPGATPPKL